MSMLIEHFPSWMSEGIFTTIESWVPWKDDTSVSANALDMEYLGNRSGNRECSLLVERFTCFRDDKTLTSIELQRLSALLKAKYNLDWSRLWDAIQEEYSPLENYNSTETETPRVITTQKHATKLTETEQNIAQGTNNKDANLNLQGSSNNTESRSTNEQANGNVNSLTNSSENKTTGEQTQSFNKNTSNGSENTLSQNSTTNNGTNTSSDISASNENGTNTAKNRQTSTNQIMPLGASALSTVSGSTTQGDTANNQTESSSASSSSSSSSASSSNSENAVGEATTQKAETSNAETSGARTQNDESVMNGSTAETTQTLKTMTDTNNANETRAETSNSSENSNYSETRANIHSSERNADENYDETSHAGTNTITKRGNIGITTSQQMLESEYQLRKTHYFDYIFECLDSVLTIPYWRTCT